MGWLWRVAGARAPNLGRPSASADPLARSSLGKNIEIFLSAHSPVAAGVPGLWPPLKFSPEPIANWYHRVASDGAQGGCTEPGSAQRLGGPPGLWISVISPRPRAPPSPGGPGPPPSRPPLKFSPEPAAHRRQREGMEVRAPRPGERRLPRGGRRPEPLGACGAPLPLP